MRACGWGGDSGVKSTLQQLGELQLKKMGLLLACATAGLAVAGPLDDFVGLAKNCQAAFDARPEVEVQYVESSKKWVKRVIAPAKLSYDVKSTTSLVSPYNAYFEVSQLMSSATAQDEQSANALGNSMGDNPILVTFKVEFAYQNSVWVATGATQRMQSKETRRNRYGEDDPMRVSVASLLKMHNPISKCLGV